MWDPGEGVTFFELSFLMGKMRVTVVPPTRLAGRMKQDDDDVGR